MANVPGAGAKLDANAAIDKHAAVTQSGSAGDLAIVTRIVFPRCGRAWFTTIIVPSGR